VFQELVDQDNKQSVNIVFAIMIVLQTPFVMIRMVTL